MENKKMTALIVDPDFAATKKLMKMLYGVGSVGLVLHAPNYSGAMHAISHREISLLLVEIVLPGRNGIEVLRTIRDKGYDANVIMLCNDPNSYYHDMCGMLGAGYLFDKSDDFEKIPFIVSQLNFVPAKKNFTQKMISIDQPETLKDFSYERP